MSSPYPTPSRKRVRMDIDRGDVQDGPAQVSRTNNIGRKKPQSRAFKRFKKSVLQVVEGEKSYGVYKKTIPITLAARFTNQWTVYQTDDFGNELRFDEPRNFKDAEGILFNGKTVAARVSDVAVLDPIGSGSNFSTLTTCHLIKSTTTFRFVNQSQQRVIVEMYKIKGREAQTYDATGCMQTFYAMMTRSFNFRAGPSDWGGGANNHLPHPGSTFSDIPGVHEFFDIDKVTYIMDPAEVAFHKIKGPRNYYMDGSKKNMVGGTETNPLWANWHNGSGYHILFRLITEPAVLTGTTADMYTNRDNAIVVDPGPNVAGLSNANTGTKMAVFRHANLTASGAVTGAVVCTVQQTLKVAAPEEAPAAQNQFVIANFQATPQGTLYKTTMDYQNPADAGSTNV